MKNSFVISCPIDTYSGYGARSRDLVKAIIELDKYDVKILPQRWGGTPWGFIEEHKEWHFLKSHLLEFGKPLSTRPDIWAQVTIPNEFQPVGQYNIGFTAGIETTVPNPKWIEGLNRMDLNLVSSTHSKKVFEDINFEMKDQNTQLEREIAERQRVEERLREREASLKESQRLARMGNWEVDLLSGKVTWSEELYNILRVNMDTELHLNSIMEVLMHPDDREMAENAIQKGLNHGKARTLRFQGDKGRRGRTDPVVQGGSHIWRKRRTRQTGRNRSGYHWAQTDGKST